MSERLKVITAFPIECRGTNNSFSNEQVVQASVTVYEDGTREVGCSHMVQSDSCNQKVSGKIGCSHLEPGKWKMR
jgi:hypothetical protein